MSRFWVYQVRACWHRDGRRSSLRVGGHRRLCVTAMESELRAWIEAEVDLTLAEICARLAQQAGIQIKVSALWHQLNKWNLTLKKPCTPANENARTFGWRVGYG